MEVEFLNKVEDRVNIKSKSLNLTLDKSNTKSVSMDYNYQGNVLELEFLNAELGCINMIIQATDFEQTKNLSNILKEIYKLYKS